MITATNDIQQYVKAGNINSKGCNSILFFNQGDVTAVINGVIKIRPGMSFSLNQTDSTIQDETTYQVRFDGADSLSTGTDQNLAVISTYIFTPNENNGNLRCKQY